MNKLSNKLRNKLIVISGPTATGKTQTSITIANHLVKSGFLTDIVNFDSLLFYKEISIGSAKPTLEERRGIPHHMIEIESIRSPMNAAQFIELGLKVIDKLFIEKKVVILVGGSAFYLRALLKGMYDSPTVTSEIKNELSDLYKNSGINPFLDYLEIHDNESLYSLHKNDHYRLMRAVEHHRMTGEKISIQKKILAQMNPYDFSVIIHPWDVLHIYLDLPKELHNEIIKARTSKMFADGLMEEISNLERQEYTSTLKPLQSIGYKEAFEFKKGFFGSKEECMERISISTRQLAKAQRTFLKKITPKESFNPLQDIDRIIDRISAFIS